MSLDPQSLPRRSPIYRHLQSLGANFEAIDDQACAMDYGDPDGEAIQARNMAIADACALPRWGLKGWNTMAWLRDHGCSVGEETNVAFRQSDGSLIAALAWGEALILGTLGGAGISQRLIGEYTLVDGIGTYPIPRPSTNFWFVVSGQHAPTMWSKLCAIDLRPKHFPDLAIAQTSVARQNSIIIRADIGETPAYHVLSDWSAAGYMWRSILDAMEEFGGRHVGLTALRRLQGH
ncbi:MAG: sarcosine oxidase [Alphaproteobacteria bacterium]